MKRYKILTSEEVEELESEINQVAKDGFELHTFLKASDSDHKYAIMVKDE